MYNIVELNDKLLAELKVIAKEMGLKKVDALKKASYRHCWQKNGGKS